MLFNFKLYFVSEQKPIMIIKDVKSRLLTQQKEGLSCLDLQANPLRLADILLKKNNDM
jgi:hypothetical protein